MKPRVATFLLSLLLVVSLCACGGKEHTNAVDREGNAITLPSEIKAIASIGPSNTEILAGLGLADKIVAADKYSEGIEGLGDQVTYIDMMSPDAELLVAVEPDVLFVTGMSKSGGEDPYKPVRDGGICVIYMPSSDSIAGIEEDIAYIAGVTGTDEKGKSLIDGMRSDVAKVRETVQAIPDPERKSVYVEIAAAPGMYSFGTGVFLNEMLDIAGAANILADQEKWVQVGDETVLSRNPDVILTTVNYLDDPVGEIMARPGWEAVTAVKDGAVYQIDTDTSNRPSQNITKGLWEIARCVYPGYFAQ